MKHLSLAQWTAAITALTVSVGAGCSCCTHEVTIRPINGTSDSVITIPPPGLRLHLRGPIRIPPNLPVPAIAGLELQPGAEIDVQIPPGDITVRDNLRLANAKLVADAQAAGLGDGRIAGHGDATFDPDGSSYAFALPDLFGPDNVVVVPITGSASFAGSTDAVLMDSYELNPDDISEFSYQLSGPGPVWTAPMQTPYGMIEGTGTIEAPPFEVSFSGDLSSLAATAMRTGENEYLVTAHVPIVFRAEDAVGTGMENETGTVSWDVDSSP
jgi:hypothetical protein